MLCSKASLGKVAFAGVRAECVTPAGRGSFKVMNPGEFTKTF